MTNPIPQDFDLSMIEIVPGPNCPPWCYGHARWLVQAGRAEGHFGGSTKVHLSTEPPELFEAPKPIYGEDGDVVEVAVDPQWRDRELLLCLTAEAEGAMPGSVDGPPLIGINNGDDYLFSLTLDEAQELAEKLANMVNTAR